jgi:uncharacterized protein (UPF0332 family)
MKSASADFFDKAQRLLAEAEVMLKVGLYEAAGRNAYLAGCYAARGLLFEDTGKVSTRHQRLWGDLTHALHERGLNDPSLTAFLPNAYALKRVADYETGSSEITSDRAEKAVSDAANYVKKLRAITKRGDA